MTSPRAAALALLVVTGVTGLAGCGGEDATSEPVAPTSSPQGEDTSSLEDEVTAKIAADAPPKDLVWRIPTVPADWQRLKTDTGDAQWRVGDSRCIVYLAQPAGLGTSASPTSQEVVREYVKRSVSSARATPSYGEANDRFVQNDVNSETVTVKTKVSGVPFTAAPGDIQGQAYAHRSGDFALAAVALCGGGEYDEHGSAIEGFLGDLEIATTY